MSVTKTTTDLATLKINYLTESMYQEALNNNEINNDELYLTPELSITTNLLNWFYPVGSYYETSDITFNPNSTWGGTWELELEGMVHISGSAIGTYQINGALTNTSDGGDTSVQTEDHTLTTAQIPNHTHTLASHNHTITNAAGISTGTWSGDTVSKDITGSGAKLAHTTGSGTVSTITSTGGSGVLTTQATTTGGGAHNHGSISTMQPYIVVNRWHRTA